MKRNANDQMIGKSKKRNNHNQHQNREQNNSYNQYPSEMENTSNSYGYPAQCYSTNTPATYDPVNYYFPGTQYTSAAWTVPMPVSTPPPLPKGPPPGSPYYNPAQPPPLPQTRHPNDGTPPPPPPSTSQNNQPYNTNNKTWNRKFAKNNFDQKNNFPNQDYGTPSPSQSFSSTSVSEVVSTPEVEKVIKVNKKSKRKPMSSRMNHKKEWNREDAVKALELEQEFNKMQKLPMLILKFPDPEVNKEIVRGYSASIENVHFQQPSTARYCFVQLHTDADIEQVKAEISSIPFGTGFIQVERKNIRDEDDALPPEDLDPYTLYIGNLPTTISVAAVKEKFPTAHRIDIGYAQRMKNTRYAFVRYESVDDALLAYRQTFNLIIESRTIIVRFRRQKGTVNLPGEPRFMPNFPVPPSPRIPLAVKKTCDLMQSVAEIDFMEDTFINDEELIRSNSVEIEEIETEVNVIEEDVESIVQNLENTNSVNITETKPDIVKEVETTNSETPVQTTVQNVVQTPVQTPDTMEIDSTLIKTEVKDEPIDDPSIYGDELQPDPISSEEGEDDDEESADGEDEEDDEAATESQKTFFWNKPKIDEIAVQNDVKPDISKIIILNSDTINEMADKGYHLILDSDLNKTNAEKVDDEEELEALYSNLNPDD